MLPFKLQKAGPKAGQFYHMGGRPLGHQQLISHIRSRFHGRVEYDHRTELTQNMLEQLQPVKDVTT